MVKRILIALFLVAAMAGCSYNNRIATPVDNAKPPRCYAIEAYDTNWIGAHVDRDFSTYCLQEK